MQRVRDTCNPDCNKSSRRMNVSVEDLGMPVLDTPAGHEIISKHSVALLFVTFMRVYYQNNCRIYN